ncbi:MAG TPA: class II glutamine amidotransferase [Stellaceae bacterium]|jgi:glutamine amidotransferase
MCELLGMSANVPTDIRFSFAGLIRRGGETGPHADGWGIAFHEGGKGCRAFHEVAPSAHSDLARFLRTHPVRSRIAVAHIRRANRGRLAVENTHPFTRELWGRTWSFAHNGQLRGVKRRPLRHYRPVGTTDSEHAFCWLLDRLRVRWTRPPSEAALCRAVRELCRDLNGLGTFNALIGDGTRLFAFCSTRLVWLTRRAPFGEAHLTDDDLVVDFSKETSPTDVVTVVATCPLTANEAWTPLLPGELLVLRAGERIAAAEPGRAAAKHVQGAAPVLPAAAVVPPPPHRWEPRIVERPSMGEAA